MSVPVVGLTGGIASGKSTVARLFRERGIPVVDADQLAREVVDKGSEGLAAIVAAFGNDVLLPDGALDRKALGARVFADAAARATLNAITHPRVALLSATRLAEARTQGAPYVMYEAPLIVENGLHRTMAALIVVSVEVPLQIERMMQRDGLDEAQGMSRIQAQTTLAQKLEAADYVIDNNQPIEKLHAQVERVHETLIARFSGGAA